jgi:outer membrane protein assembly factor BamB
MPLSPDEAAEAVEAKIALSGKRFDAMTFGDLGLTVQVTALQETPEPRTILIMPYDPKALQGLERSSVRIFRYDARLQSFQAIWNSGINLAFHFVWAKIQRPGTYLPIGLPRDRLLKESLRALAYERSLRDNYDPQAARELTLRYLEPFLQMDAETLERLRDLITRFEISTTDDIPLAEYNFGLGGHPLPFHLPRGDSLDAFRERLQGLEVLPQGLPEERLFQPPESSPPGGTPWAMNPEVTHWDVLARDLIAIELDIRVIWPWPFPWPFPWLSKDWPMYQHDRRHSGAASGISSINSTTVSQLTQRFKVNLDGGPVNSKPSIVGGRAYVGTTRHGGGPGGTLYKINLCNGCIEGKFPTPADPAHYSIHGIGGSPAIYQGKVYFTTVAGKVYCIDAASMTESPPHPPAIWVTDLKNPSAAQKQPVRNPSGDCWSSPLVVNDKVYVGSGEGEVPTCWGFIWCLDANNGQVLWLFCTNKAQNINTPGNENQPNQIPRSAAVSDPLPGWATAAGFSLINDPPETGSSPWSSLAYDPVLNRVYVGTGNSQYPNAIAPDQHYGSGLIALDANTGQFQGFHTSQPDDSYHANDTDIDVPGAPTFFTRGGQRVICYGSKNGSFFLLDPANLQVLGGGAQRRQLLARENGSGHPGNRGNPIPGVATGGGIEENRWGVMATPAVHARLGKIFVGLGGYLGAGDGTKTPFIRALDWNNLNDAWPAALGADGITRYTLANPPVYQEVNEAALSSPAVVNDVVFVSTTNPARNEMSLYALDAATGLCLWAAPKVSNGGWPNYALGPAISGEYVVAGAGDKLYIYTRPGTPWCLCLRFPFPPWWERWRERFPPWPPEQIGPLGE